MARVDAGTAKLRMIDRGLWPVGEFVNTQVRWLCVCMTCGDFVKPRYNNVVNKRAGGCKRCASTSTAAKLGLHAETAKTRMIERGVWPIAAFVKTLAPWPSVCMECGAFVSPSYANVVTKGQGGCVVCATKLRTVDVAQAKQQMIGRGVWPIKEFVNTSDPWLCVCMTCGAFVNPRYNSVVHKTNGGCKHCGRPDLDPAEAKQRMIYGGLWPVSDYPGTNKPWLCVCMICGEFVRPRHAQVRSRASGCGFCARKAVHPNRVKARMIERGVWPVEEFKGTHSKWLCVCLRCGEFVTPRTDSVLQGQGGCPHCATSGFKPDAPALLYLMTHPGLRAAKVGVCNIGSGRIRKHERAGWVLDQSDRIFEFETGRQAKAVEMATVKIWRSRGIGWGEVLDAERYDGFTETVSLIREDGTVTDVEELWADVLNAGT